jgi:aubergine-like protein
MVVVILPMLSDSKYARVKRLCCIEMPVPSQVIVLKTINKTGNVLRTVVQKIVLQMNCKLGGELWRLSIPIKKMMIVGIDVYHKIEKKYKSIAGFVSSLNQDQTRWYSRICFQMVGQELADTLKVAFLQSIKKYQEVNGFLPEKIFVFRDGVSEGQIPVVAEHEVAQLRSCFTSDYCPQISVIVVQKRISTRIFAADHSNAIVNPKPGAIIDTSITSKEMFDFFLVSQHVNQGTVTPTHYIVAYDDTNYKPDYIQRLSYKMTHMYYNWSGTIRVPAPCQVNCFPAVF